MAGLRDDDLLKEIRTNFAACEDWEATARENFILDVKFGNGDARNLWQWPDDVQRARSLPGSQKPMLTVNKTRQHCLQIINDARQNKVGIQIRPVGGEATEKAAELYEALIRGIEYRSNATLAYEAAMYNAVFGGIGYVRVHVDYADEDSFDQDIFIKRVADPLTIYLDPDIQEYDGSDARFGFVFEDLPRKEAEAKYRRYKEAFAETPVDDADSWCGREKVRICEYFWRVEKPDTLIALPDGQTVRKSELPPGAYDMLKAEVEAAGLELRERPTVNQAVEWCKVIGNTIVERKPWLGKYIPIARLVGEETVIEGQMDRKGHVRALLDPQKMYNYNSSGSVEFVALQTKSPWLASARAVEGNMEQWTEANIKNASVLIWNDVDEAGNPIPPPQRIAPPPAASGHIEGMQVAQQEMMLVSGQYQAIMGAPSNETSGKAINARQRQGDNATYHFIDHQAVMIRFLGRIVLDLIPKVYDTARVLQAVGKDDKRFKIAVDPNAATPAEQQADPADEDFDAETVAAVLNPAIGKYDVISDVGPSYATQRQEAFNAFSQIMQQQKGAWEIVGDLWAESADFPGSEKLAERLRKLLPPAVKGGPSPAEQQMQQQLQAISQTANAAVEQLQAQLAEAEQKLKDQEADIQRKDYEAETQRLSAVGKIDPEALKPVVREMVSQMLGQPVVPLMAQHAAADQAMQPAPEPVDAYAAQ
jgi:hypothetical protein